MFVEGKAASLNGAEKRIVKRLLADGKSNQDIQADVNLGRKKSINFARISAVKEDENQEQATDAELDIYYKYKKAYDPSTGLNPYRDERLVKSREAMKLAVSVFNNPATFFRTEQFLVMSNIAWTYLVLEYLHNKNISTKRRNGNIISLADFIKHKKCPFSDAVKQNLQALIKLRNSVVHKVLGGEDPNWRSLLQANCLNYEKFIVNEFGENLSLREDLAFALHFSSLELNQASEMANANLPAGVRAINKELFKGLNGETIDNQEFRFSVIYTTVAASKSKAAIRFINPEDAEGKEIANVLIKKVPAEETHPYLASQVWNEVTRQTGQKFNSYDHTMAWKHHKVRPDGNAEDPAKTDEIYCHYNKTIKRYTYSEKWISKLCEKVKRA